MKVNVGAPQKKHRKTHEKNAKTFFCAPNAPDGCVGACEGKSEREDSLV